METPEQEKARVLETGIILEPLPVFQGDNRVRINGQAPAADCRIVTEGQWRALLQVWLDSGRTLHPIKLSGPITGKR